MPILTKARCNSFRQHFAEVLTAFGHAKFLWWRHVDVTIDLGPAATVMSPSQTLNCGGCSAVIVQGPVLICLKRHLLPQRRCCLGM